MCWWPIGPLGRVLIIGCLVICVYICKCTGHDNKKTCLLTYNVHSRKKWQIASTMKKACLYNGRNLVTNNQLSVFLLNTRLSLYSKLLSINRLGVLCCYFWNQVSCWVIFLSTWRWTGLHVRTIQVNRLLAKHLRPRSVFKRNDHSRCRYRILETSSTSCN